ncbi:hypothetical protein B0H34DRAFT_720125 [Crassisporium funariophilum]|nr:hypothetical protein B0H34DRAFT_720125 [Crassisporium funariophilum]
MQNQLTRAQGSLLMQLQSGHIALNAHLHRVGGSATDKCQACRGPRQAQAVETVPHFLFECPKYETERRDMDSALGHSNRSLRQIMRSKEKTKAMLRFIGRTGRLRKTLGDVTPRAEALENNES